MHKSYVNDTFVAIFTKNIVLANIAKIKRSQIKDSLQYFEIEASVKEIRFIIM